MIELLPELLAFVPLAAVFDRMVYSAFTDGRLHNLLRARSATTLIVTGSEADICVLSTILAAVDHGYRIVVVSDGLCSSSDESHDALLGLYRSRFDIQIEVAESTEVLDRWRF